MYTEFETIFRLDSTYHILSGRNTPASAKVCQSMLRRRGVGGTRTLPTKTVRFPACTRVRTVLGPSESGCAVFYFSKHLLFKELGRFLGCLLLIEREWVKDFDIVSRPFASHQEWCKISNRPLRSPALRGGCVKR